MKSIGGLNAIGAPLSPNQIGGENFIRHIGNDKLIFDFKSGSGTTVKDRSREGNDGTLGSGAAAPTWKRNSLYFDGGDYVKITTMTDFDTNEGIIIVSFKVDSIGSQQDLFASSDEASTDYWFNIGINDSGYFRFAMKDDEGIINSIVGNQTVFVAGTRYIIAALSNGSSYSIFINGMPETFTVEKGSDDGKWLNDVPYRDNVAIGAQVRNTVHEYCTGIEYIVRYIDGVLSQIEIQQEYLVNKFAGNN